MSDLFPDVSEEEAAKAAEEFVKFTTEMSEAGTAWVQELPEEDE